MCGVIFKVLGMGLLYVMESEHVHGYWSIQGSTSTQEAVLM